MRYLFAFLRTHWAIFLLFLVGLAMRLWLAQADPFLHPWDEQFHALVARRMMDDPFTPMLHTEIIGQYDPFAWCCNTVWLHKQPLFMWQMALSMKLFGASEWAMRLPSALMGAAMILLLYRCTWLLSRDRALSLLAAALLCFSGIQMRIGAGIIGMDHNDTALQFYILLSFWALAEFLQRPTWGWAMLIGLASGAAILNKWLLGLAVFLPWGFLTLHHWWQTREWRSIGQFVAALAVACAVFIPWQVYILMRWPELAAHEYEFNRRHLTEALEGHAGGYDFYFLQLEVLLGKYLPFLLPFGGWLGWRYRRQWDGRLLFSYALIAIFVFVFLSVIATKVLSHIFFIAPFLLIFSAAGLLGLLRWLPLALQRWAMPLAVSAAIFWALNPSYFIHYYSDANEMRVRRIHNAAIYRRLPELLPADIRVVSNLPEFEHVSLMFYQPQYLANHWALTPDLLDSLGKLGKRVAIFEQRMHYFFAPEIAGLPNVVMIPIKLN